MGRKWQGLGEHKKGPGKENVTLGNVWTRGELRSCTKSSQASGFLPRS